MVRLRLKKLSEAATMVQWTEFERKAIDKVWSYIDIDVIGPLTLQR